MEQKFKDAVILILFNTFVSFCGIMFQQVKGIPMGGNCSPLQAYIFFIILWIFIHAETDEGEKKIRISSNIAVFRLVNTSLDW